MERAHLKDLDVDGSISICISNKLDGKGVESINLSHDKDKLWAIVKAVLNFCSHRMREIS